MEELKITIDKDTRESRLTYSGTQGFCIEAFGLILASVVLQLQLTDEKLKAEELLKITSHAIGVALASIFASLPDGPDKDLIKSSLARLSEVAVSYITNQVDGQSWK